MSTVSAQTAAVKYGEFNQLFTATFEKDTVPTTDLRQLLLLRQIITRTSIPAVDFQTKDSLFPQTITTRNLLLEDMHTKIEAVRMKWKGLSGSVNGGHNCWIIAALQVMLRIPHLRQALITVGTFFNEGNSFDKVEMRTVSDKVALYRQNPELYHDQLEQAKSHYKKITHSIFRLRTFQVLKDGGVPSDILAQFRVPKEYKNRIREYARITATTIGKPTRDQLVRIYEVARKHVLESPETGYIAKENLLKKCGHDLLQAITAFDQAAAQNKPVPAEISQNVRLALYYLSQTRRANGELSSSFSPKASISEDSNEGILKIMSEYERIVKLQGTAPTCYFPTETICRWIPDPASPLEPHDPTRSRLAFGCYSSETLNDHQILVTVPKQATPMPDKRPMHLEELLKRNCRHPGTVSHKYQREDGQIQLHKCVEVRQVIHGVPEQLSFVLNRFIHDEMGSSKNYLNVRVPRIMAIPAEMTTASKPVAYKLDAFVEHSGTINKGHYIAYVNVEGQWIKCDDQTITLMTDFEIDVLLNKTVGDKTPYYFYYSKFPDQAQKDMLGVAADMRAQAAAIEKEDVGSPVCDQRKVLELLAEVSGLLKDPKLHVQQLKELIKIFKTQYPEHMKMLYLLLDLDSGAENPPGTIEKLCDDAPEQLGKVLKPWMSQKPQQNAVEQLMAHVTMEQEFNDLEQTAQHFEHLLTLLFSDGTEEQFMEQFEKLPIDVQKRIQDALPVEAGEKLTFEGAMKYGTLRKYIRDKLVKDVRINLSTIGQDLHTQLENKKKGAHARHLVILFTRIQDGATAKQILKMFESFDFPLEVKNMLYFKVCKADKKADNAHLGKRLFEQNPFILVQPIAPIAAGKQVYISDTIIGELILALAPK